MNWILDPTLVFHSKYSRTVSEIKPDIGGKTTIFYTLHAFDNTVGISTQYFLCKSYFYDGAARRQKSLVTVKLFIYNTQTRLMDRCHATAQAELLCCKRFDWSFSDFTHSLTAALDQLRVVASCTSNDPGPRSRQHQQIGQCLLPLAAANFSVDDAAGASSQQREECRCGLLLTVEVPAKQVCSPVGDRCDQIMNDVCQQ